MFINKNIIVIGYGVIAKEHIKAFKSIGATIKAIIKNDIHNMKADFPFYNWNNFPGFSKDIDAIVCAISNEEEIKVLKKHVPDSIPTLYEKPLFNNKTQFDSFLSETTNEKKDNTYIAYNRRHYITVNSFKDIINNNHSYYLEASFSDRYINLIRDGYSNKSNLAMYITSHWVDMIGYLIGYDKLSKFTTISQSPYHISFQLEESSKHIVLNFTPDQARNHSIRLVTLSGEEFLLSPIEKLHKISLEIDNNTNKLSATNKYSLSLQLINEESTSSNIKPGFINQAKWFLNEGINEAKQINYLDQIDEVFKFTDFIQEWSTNIKNYYI